LGGTIAIGGAVAAGGAFLIVSYVKKSREIKTISLKKGEN